MSLGPDRLRVAAAQYPLDPVADLVAWGAKAARWVADGAATGASLLVFPEYGAIELAATRGPAVTADLSATLAAVADLQVETAAVWTRLSREHSVYVLAPSGPERRGDAFVNAARLYSPSGGMGVQDKLILTPFERDWGLAPGATLRVLDTALGRIGIAICYDCEFPLTVRAMVEAGAEMILVPSCTEQVSGLQRVRVGAAARALESQVACVVSHTVGEAPWSPAVDCNAGRAAVLVPAEAQLSMTGVLAEGELNAPGWVAADIDFATLARIRTVGEMRNSADWARQVGCAPLASRVEVVKLD